MSDPKQQAYNEWLVIRSQQGERQAFDELLRNWHRRFYLYAMNRLGDGEVAQDVTQECLISISKSINKLADPAAFPKWGFRILERRCVDWQRKIIREREVLSPQEELPEVADSDGTEDKLSVEALLAKLDSRLSGLLRLYYLEALTLDEIASIYEVPVGTIKSRLFYARKLLGKELGRELQGSENQRTAK